MGDRGGYRKKREKKPSRDNGVGKIHVKRNGTENNRGTGKKIYNHGFDEFNKLG